MTRERQTLRISVTGERGGLRNERGVSGDLRWTRIAANEERWMGERSSPAVERE